MSSSARIFLAHNKEDKPTVQRLYKVLKDHGLTPWLESADLLPGQSLRVEVPKAILGARVLVACLSSRSVGRVGLAPNDLRFALTVFGQCPPGSIRLVPLRLDACEVPHLEFPGLDRALSDLDWLDLFATDGPDRLLRLLTEEAESAPESGMVSAEADPAPLSSFRDSMAPWCPEMVVIPPGRFHMGSPPNEPRRYKDEGPQTIVRIAEPFALGRFPVTFEEYDAFALATGRELPGDEGWGRGERPVINVSWQDAQAMVEWLGQQTGEAYLLPSEAEWEYACRAGTATPFSVGETISAAQANYDGQYAYAGGRKGLFRQETSLVGSFAANAFGLHDMHGNVWEWCADIWHGSYDGAPGDGTAWLDDGDPDRRVLRGGAWNSMPWFLRSAVRNRLEPDTRDYNLGFRVARLLG